MIPSRLQAWIAGALLALGGLLSSSSAQTADADARLRTLLADEWERGLRESPTFASYLGDLRYNDRWADVGLAAQRKRFEHQQQLLQQLDAIDPGKLSPAERLNFDLFRRQTELAVAEYPLLWRLVPLNQREGIQDENSVADSLPFNRVKDYEDWIARLERFPPLMEQTIEVMREGIRQRVLQPKATMRRVPQQIARQLVEEPEQSLYYKPLLKMPATISAADQARLRERAALAVREHILPAYRKFAQFFNDEYLPACYDQVGIWQAPGGKALYAFRARMFTTTDLTPAEIHAIGLREVARIRGEMAKVQRQAGFEGTFREFLEHLRTEKRFYFDSPEELLTEYRAICQKIDPQLPKLFRKLPRTPYNLEAIPGHMAPDTTAAYYRPPAADGSRPGTYFVNLYRPEMRPKYEMEALSLHEAVPGHHLQIALATELEGVPQFRKFSNFTAFIEGWALYAERLGDDLGCYRDPYSRFGQLTYEMWRAVRLVVDTGMHDQQWTRERAIAFFQENTAKTELDIANEVDRYISWPGQALAYKIGELKIRELRAVAEKQLGDRFDIREFHDILLRDGSLPLDLLERRVRAWLAEK